MRLVISLALGAALTAPAGCGSKTANTAPLTDEQKQKIKEEDRQTDDQESGGRGAKLGGKAKPKQN